MNRVGWLVERSGRQGKGAGNNKYNVGTMPCRLGSRMGFVAVAFARKEFSVLISCQPPFGLCIVRQVYLFCIKTK